MQTSSGGAAASGGVGDRGGLGGATSSGGSLGGSAAKGGSVGATGGASVAANAGPSCPEMTRGTWLPIASSDAPTPRTNEWVIPTDDGMLVWGGLGVNSMGAATAPYFDNGAIYHLCDDSWSPMSSAGAPASLTAQITHTVPPGTWTGGELIVWGGIGSPAIVTGYPEGAAPLAGSLFDARSNSWKDMNHSGEPTARDEEARVWTGKELLIWGGVAQSGDRSWANHQDGALFDPASNSWRPMSTDGAPEGRALALPNQYVWTGTQFIVWGGLRFDSGTGFDPALVPLASGGIYDVASDSWTTIAAQGAPTHGSAEVFWTGSKLLVLGILDGRSTPGELEFDGALLDPVSNSWSAVSAPAASLASDFVWADGARKTLWAGSSLVLLGERISPSGGSRLKDVALVYSPSTDRWRSANLPFSHNAMQIAEVVDGKLVLGGAGPSVTDAAGADHLTTRLTLFDPDTLTFSELPLLRDRSTPSVVSSAHHLLVWGGRDVYTDLGAPNPCQNAASICDPITPTVSKLLGDGLAFGF
jgi:hypothetical protein